MGERQKVTAEIVKVIKVVVIAEESREVDDQTEFKLRAAVIVLEGGVVSEQQAVVLAWSHCYPLAPPLP